jgi:hypothetical protein
MYSENVKKERGGAADARSSSSALYSETAGSVTGTGAAKERCAVAHNAQS